VPEADRFAGYLTAEVVSLRDAGRPKRPMPPRRRAGATARASLS
jgi:hypothetical protein